MRFQTRLLPQEVRHYPERSAAGECSPPEEMEKLPTTPPPPPPPPAPPPTRHHRAPKQSGPGKYHNHPRSRGDCRPSDTVEGFHKPHRGCRPNQSRARALVDAHPPRQQPVQFRPRPALARRRAARVTTSKAITQKCLNKTEIRGISFSRVKGKRGASGKNQSFTVHRISESDEHLLPEGRATDNVYRRQAVGAAGPVSDLAIDVPPPTLDAASGGECAGVCAARGDGSDSRCQARHAHRRQAVGAAGPVSNLATAGGAPTLDAASGGERAGVRPARGDATPSPKETRACASIVARVACDAAASAGNMSRGRWLGSRRVRRNCHSSVDSRQIRTPLSRCGSPGCKRCRRSRWYRSAARWPESHTERRSRRNFAGSHQTRTRRRSDESPLHTHRHGWPPRRSHGFTIARQPGLRDRYQIAVGQPGTGRLPASAQFDKCPLAHAACRAGLMHPPQWRGLSEH